MGQLELGTLFGACVRRLRRLRGWSQELLAQRCRLSADTIRRIELGQLSPSLRTIDALCEGLRISHATLMAAVVTGEVLLANQLADLVVRASAREREQIHRVLRALFPLG